ncbi:histidine kinase [Aureitalea sp. L0-47]|uniref:tetratricopeptide repeat-containing sensor histidine kinase n=1 Tax=Aureitalea sp. L0-47 TaxID=2816962 RepID=UPI0022388830|nr:histidine kinase [Aureitalea sp. L0-47]MCW5519902.1 histidine kinase [Aureitalea sp. L0-47]
MCSFFSWAQTGQADIDTLLSRSKAVYQSDLDSALVFVNDAYRLAIERQDSAVIAMVAVTKSFYHFTRDEPQKVEETLQFLFDNPDKVPLSSLGQAYNHMGGVKYRHVGMDEALRMYFKAIEIQEQANNFAGLARTYLNLGMIYNGLEKKDLAEYFFEKSAFNSSRNSQGNQVHEVLNENFAGPENQLKITLNALQKTENKERSILAAILYSDLSAIHYDLGDYSLALQSGNKALEIMNRINFTTNLQLTHYNVGMAQLGLGQFRNAQISFEKAIATTDILKQKVQFNEALIRAHRESGDYRAAFEAQRSLGAIKDSINTKQENDRIAEITAQFETEKQAQEIEILEGDVQLQAAQLKNQRGILIGVVALVALLGVILFFAYKNHKIKQNLQFSELTQKLLQMQLNPHFLFNALNGIQYFIRKNDTKKSTRYITNFSGLMRNILENSVEKFISIEEDHATISDFLALQQLVHNNSFKYSVTIDKNLDAQNTAIPPMFTQPFVENAIIHGVSGLKEGQIDVRYGFEDSHVKVEIQDNGKGIYSEKKNANSLHKSMGTSITKQRMENLSKAEKYPIELEIISENDLETRQGTKIVLTFPMKYL